ncbi:MAG: hypothetical protein ACRDJC_09645 [Thermomicrobiales bacterium]
MTSSRSGSPINAVQAGVSRLTQGARLVLAATAVAVALGVAPVATAFLQVPDEPSPESGTAQVVAHGVVDIADGDLRWRVTERTAPPPANAAPMTGELGFIVTESGVVLAEDLDSGEQTRLPGGEAMLTRPGSEHIRAALGSDAAIYRELALVDAAAADPSDGTVLFGSEPFTGPGASHDLDLVEDVLGPGVAMTMPGGALPTLVFLLAGGADVATEAGDVVSLGSGEGIVLSGLLTITAAENGAEVAAVYTGPAVPRLAQVAATPASDVRVIEVAETESEPVAPAAASPTVVAQATEPAVVDVDDDGDGLTASEEVELNTDPALADTDEDGLTDGQEALEVGTAPLAPDTDADGILDGDEVAQGTNPLDGVAGAVVEEPPAEEPAAPAEEPAAEAPAVEPAAAPGDTDGDGLEDTIEAELGTDPFDADTDDDGATDGDEYYVLQTGTRNPDSDGDGVLDGTEAANGTDPNDINSF